MSGDGASYLRRLLRPQLRRIASPLLKLYEVSKKKKREKKKRVMGDDETKEGAKEGGMGSVVSVLAQTVTGLQASHSSTGLPHSIIRSDDVLNNSTSPDLMTCTTVA